jgi:hypothetical protein
MKVEYIHRHMAAGEERVKPHGKEHMSYKYVTGSHKALY